MQIPIRMCDARLSDFIDVYGYWHLPMENIATFAPGLIAFNLSGAHIEVDGKVRTEPVLMGIANEPMSISFTIGGGDIVSLRITSHAYDRLFHIDPSEETGTVGLDWEKHPRIAAIYERLKAVPANPESWFATLDEALLKLLPEAKPVGMLGEMIRMVRSTDRNWTVAEVARELGCSPRTLERACKLRYGRSPKTLLRGLRLFRTRSIEEKRDERIELQPEFTYADLPHYLNELRKLFGLNRKQMGEDALFGNDFPYSYIWPDGTIAETAEELEAWHAEMERRIEESRG